MVLFFKPQTRADSHHLGPGIGLSERKQPSQWAAPIVQFILPSVIFSMTIPRRKKIDFGYLLDFRLRIGLRDRHPWLNNAVHRAVYLVLFIFIMIPVIIDTLIWIFVIIVGAGNMIVAGLLEAHLDYRIVKYCKDKRNDHEDDPRMKRELLTTIVAGNLQLEHGNPQQAITRSLILHDGASPADGEEKSMSRLLNLLEAQSSFGGAVGSPVLFFLGAFIYTILDLEQNPSSEDAAISLAFGIEWMNIVNVAIVSGCLLAANNPSTSAGIVGGEHEALHSHRQPFQRTSTQQATSRPGDMHKFPSHRRTRKDYVHYLLGWSDAYETEFQPVSLWSRGTNKMKWIKKSEAWRVDEEFRDAMKITWLGWIFKVFAPTIFLVALPPASGAVVAFYFPPRGLGCRCLTFMIYGFCQALVSAISVVRNASEVNDGPPQADWGTRGLYLFLWSVSFFAAVGGTTFQVVGVFRNCVCASLAGYWLNIYNQNPSINLATDTQDARSASFYWILMGAIATVFVGQVSYIAWWYQKIVRHRFTDAVRNLYTPSSAPPSPRASIGSPELRDSAAVRLLTQDEGNSRAELASQSMDLARLRPETASPPQDPSLRSRWSWTSTEPLIRSSDGREAGVELSPLG